jgi:hypothetical protein
MRAFYAAAIVIALFSTSSARADSSPIVFQKDAESCYRIPSLAETASGYLAVVEHRHGIFGKKTCNDDGTIDLVSKTSTNGDSWSQQHVIVSSEKFGEALASPSSPIYDPAFAGVSKQMRLVRVGNQGLVAKGNDAYLLFVGQYNTMDACEGKQICLNSPENLRTGQVKARLFLTRSTDGGHSWTAPVRVHSEIYSACTDQFIHDPSLNAAIKKLFVDDKQLSAGAYQTYLAVMQTLVATRQPDPEGAAQALKVSASVVRANLPAMQLLFLPNIRLGPGNGVAFPKGNGTRFVFPSVPFNIISDDNMAKFQCSDTLQITRSGERQIAWMGGDTLLMTLRLRNKSADLNDVRLFSISKDGGNTWSQDKPIVEDGQNLMPDSIAQAAIVGINNSNPPMAMHFNLADPDNAVTRPGAKRMKRAMARADRRNTLSAVRLYLEPSGLVPATTNGCEPDGTGDNVAYKVIWPGSAAYSAAVYSEKQKTVGLLFEASDDDGPALAYRAWNESVRFTKIPVGDVKGTAPSTQACTK